MLGMLGASVISGRLVTRWGRYRIFPIVGTALMTVGAYLLSMIDASTNGWVLAGYMFVFGVGMGLVMQVLVVAVQEGERRSGTFVAEEEILNHGEVGSQRQLLEHHPNAEPAGARNVGYDDRPVVNADLAAVHPINASDDLRQRRFSSTILAEQDVNFAAPQVERRTVQRSGGPKPF